MHAAKIGEHVYLIDVETAGIKNFIASYVLKGKSAAIIETGPTSSVLNLLSGLKALKLDPRDITYIAVSHIHLDHGGGVGTLLKYLPNAEVIVHQRGAPHLVNPEKLWQQSIITIGNVAEVYGEPEPVPEERIITASDGSVFDVGNNVEFKVVETIGHASHHLSYYEQINEAIFTGDAAGIYLNDIEAIIPTTPPPFRLDMALSSLDKLIKLKPKVLYYSHFGKAHNAVENLQKYMQQLKFWAKIVKKGVENNENVDAISKKIIESDEATQKAIKYITVHQTISEGMLYRSIQGFVDFIEKFKEISTSHIFWSKG
ncbi:MAG: MBL fold metallo-hydrolase [Candidatus Bathyarchaeia archaeon]